MTRDGLHSKSFYVLLVLSKVELLKKLSVLNKHTLAYPATSPSVTT